jgi:phage baseplate assembly protein W
MTQPRAWCFLHPHFDASEVPGFRISRTGGIEMVGGGAALRQSLLLLLTTSPGERLMRPDYGCNVSQLMFMPNDPTTHGLAIHYIRQAIERWEPRIEILRLDAEADPQQPGNMLITLEYRARSNLQKESLHYSLALA